MGETLHQAARFLVPAWPFIAACLLGLQPETRARASARVFSLAGLALTVGLMPLLDGQDLLARWGCLLASTVPALAWREDNGRFSAALTFLASGIVMLALSAKIVLLVVCLGACGALILAFNETLVTARARQAWEPMRVRMAGLVMTLLGTSMTTLGPDPALMRLGDLFVAIGLCLLAGLGLRGMPAGGDRTDTRTAALLDMLLCISAVALMLRLPERELTHGVLLLAGLAGLWICVLRDQDSPRISVALAIIAAALPVGIIPSLLCLTTSLALAADPAIPSSMRRWMQSGLPPWPGFAASCMILAALAHTGAGAGTHDGSAPVVTDIGGTAVGGIALGGLALIGMAVAGLALGLLASRSSLDVSLPVTWRDRALVLALLVTGLATSLTLGWQGLPSTGILLRALPDPTLNWHAP